MVKTLFYVLLLAALALSGQSLAQSSQAYIKLSLDSTEIYPGDVIVLEVESSGLLDPIDFTPLAANNTVVRETGGTRIAVIKGKVVEIAIKRIDLIPTNTGLTVIGPLLAGDITSNSVHVTVLNEARPSWQPVTDDFQISTTLTPETPLVNQQVLFTIELLHRYPINNEKISLPELSGFATRVLLENRRTFKDDNKDWFRTQWQYLLFPAQSGLLNLGGIQWAGTATKSRVERAEMSRSVEQISLNVLPAMVDSGQWWLPASDLQLEEQWSSPATELRAGDEVERTIIITAESVLAGQIPSPDIPESRALKQTLLNTSRTEQVSNNIVVSTAAFTYRIKAQSPIPVFLDTVRLSWWNTIDSTTREAILPARRINVGLPDRADLLSTIALQDSGITRAKHWLQSTTWLRKSVYTAAALATLVIIGLIAPMVLAPIKHRAQLHKRFRTMYALADRGDAKALYQLLSQAASREQLAGRDAEIINTLHRHLFSASTTNLAPSTLTDMVNSIKKGKLYTSRAAPDKSSALASL